MYVKSRILLTLFVIASVLLLGGRQPAFAVGADGADLNKNGPIYHGDPDSKNIALTVNVFWGEEYLPAMLETMARHKVRATFFIGGTWAEKYPELVLKIHDAGHEIGSHGYAHPHPDLIGKEGNLRDINKAGSILYRITGHTPQLYAPPYGERGPEVLEAARDSGYTTILWSVDTIDWQRPGAEVITRRVMGRAEGGSIVLMHPTAPTVEALPFIITGLREKGYQFVTVSDLLAED